MLIEKYPQSVPQNLRNATGNLRNETELGAILTEVGLVKIIQGGTSSLQGTWFNDDITIEFARWLSPAFAIWCNDRIKEYLMNGLKPLSKAEMRMQVFMDMQADISRQSNVIKKQSKRIAALVSQLESEKEAKRERLAIASEVKSGDIEKWLSESRIKGLYKLSDLHRRYHGYDALALEPIGKHEQYLGRRTKRGLFRSSVGKLINADKNGALNIMRKVVGDSYVSRIVNSGHSLCPVRYSNPFVRIV